MSKKIIGVTVGTPLGVEKIKEKIKPLSLTGGTMEGAVTFKTLNDIKATSAGTANTDPTYVATFKGNSSSNGLSYCTVTDLAKKIPLNLPYRLAATQASGTGYLTDPDNGLQTGFYYVKGTTNRPPFSQNANDDYRILVTAYGDNWLQQIATDFRCDDIFYRRKANNYWQPWAKIYPDPSKQNKLTGEEGQVVGFDANGNAVAQDAPSGGGAAIIDVVELPTENINEDVLYRKLSGLFLSNGFRFEGWTLHCVESLPEVGEPATSDLQSITAYYNASDGVCYGYADAMLSMWFRVPEGWYDLGTLLGAAGFAYGGVVYSMADATEADTFYVLIEYVLYSHKGGWTPMKIVGRAGVGADSAVFGFECTAEGDFAFACGRSTYAAGEASHTEGISTVTSDDWAHAEGYHTQASKQAAHAEGQNTWAAGQAAHAEGDRTEAKGSYSHAEGTGTKAYGEAQHTQGRWNILDSDNKYAHIVGNGTSWEELSNAHTIDWSGLGWFAGGLKVGGTGQDDAAAKTVVAADAITAADNGKFLRVVDGAWAAVLLTDVSEVGA